MTVALAMVPSGYLVTSVIPSALSITRGHHMFGVGHMNMLEGIGNLKN